MKLFIASSSSEDIDSKYMNDCESYLNKLLKDNDLMFGSYDKGIMGLCSKIAKENNRFILGCGTGDYTSENYDMNLLVNSITDRTSYLIKNSDAIIILPGGIGTINELFVAIDLKRSGEISVPIVIYNSNHYYDELFVFLDKLYNEKFSPSSVKDVYHVSDSYEDTIKYLNN